MSDPIGEFQLQGILKTQYAAPGKKKKKKVKQITDVSVPEAYKKIKNRTSQLNDVLSQM